MQTTYKDLAAVLASLQSGQSDAQIYLTPLAVWYARQGTFRYTQIPEYGNMLIGIVTAKGAGPLQQALVAGLKQLQQDGVYQALLNKWGLPYLSYPTPGVNQGASATLYK